MISWPNRAMFFSHWQPRGPNGVQPLGVARLGNKKAPIRGLDGRPLGVAIIGEILGDFWPVKLFYASNAERIALFIKAIVYQLSFAFVACRYFIAITVHALYILLLTETAIIPC